MKAFAMSGPRRGEFVEVPDPELGPEDVMIETRFVGLCGTDLNTWRGLSPMVRYPRIVGHEIGGSVVARGAAVPETVRVGARVMVAPYTNCGLCPSCLAGRPNCCQFNRTLGVQRDGALTARIAVPYGKVFAGESLSFEELALAEPLGVGYHTANRGRVRETDTVLVLGCGAIGLGAIAASARKGATVIAVDIDDAKLDMARRFGARHTVNSRNRPVEEAARELTGGSGPSVAIEAIGLPATFRLAVDAVAYAGRVVYVGHAKDEVTYDARLFVAKELDILGARNALLVFPTVLRMLEERAVPFGEMITRVYPFEQAAQAFADWDAAPARFTRILIGMA
jgi:threonine dehydrogenase-like Zn-dependent dehydrogenase